MASNKPMDYLHYTDGGKASPDSAGLVTKERGEQYGDWSEQARMAQLLKEMSRTGASWERLSSCQKESIEMILMKVSRIVSGNPDNVDSWLDIEGYARITRERL